MDTVSAGIKTEEGSNAKGASHNTWEKIVGFAFGVCFVSLLLIINIFIPNPTPTQHQTFIIVLSLAAAGIGGILAGFIQVEGTFQKILIRAGGALALFIIVFFFEPAMPKPSSIETPAINIENKGIYNTGTIQNTINSGVPVDQSKKD